MKLYAIRRRDGWHSPEELQATAGVSTRVGDEEMSEDIRWIRSYVVHESDGALGTVCIYQASSPEKVREHAERVGHAGDGDLRDRRHGARPAGSRCRPGLRFSLLREGGCVGARPLCLARGAHIPARSHASSRQRRHDATAPRRHQRRSAHVPVERARADQRAHVHDAGDPRRERQAVSRRAVRRGGLGEERPRCGPDHAQPRPHARDGRLPPGGAGRERPGASHLPPPCASRPAVLRRLAGLAARGVRGRSGAGIRSS